MILFRQAIPSSVLMVSIGRVMRWLGTTKKLLGERQHYKKNLKNKTAKVKRCDAWGQHGIYARYSDFQLVYVGLANSKGDGIGSRLRAHHKFARMANRWDSFSWFGINRYDEKGKMKPYVKRALSEAPIIRTLELIAILIADPRLNKSHGQFQGAERILQARIDYRRDATDSVVKLRNEIRALTAKLEKL
ncbi:MAG TPA: hypothetical protein VK684_09295 [Edaphobacter sp.]|nr:hypothetical protein [Edaphobacter sp.]